MQKTFLSNLILVLILNLLVKPFYVLGIDAEVLKQVESSSPGSYGEYFSLLGLTFILNIFLDFGITNYNTRNIAQNSRLVREYFTKILTLRAILSIVFFAILFIVGFALGYNQYQFELLAYLGINQVLLSFILYLRSNLAGLMLFKQDSFISVLDRVILIIFCSVLLWGNITEQAFQIEWFIWAQTAAYGITALIALILVLRKTGRLKPKLNIKFSRVVLKKSLPYAILVLLMMIYYRSDSVMLERMLDDEGISAAVYARGFRFFEALSMVGYLFAGLLLPIFSRMLKKKIDVSPIFSMSSKLILFYAISFGMCFFMFSEQIMQWRFDIHNGELVASSETFQILMLCFILFITHFVFGTLLTANGNLKKLNLIALISVFVNIGLNIVLIPKYQAYGAAIASLITQAVTAIAQIYFIVVELKIKIKAGDFISFIIFIAGIIGIFVVIPKLNIDSWQYALLLTISGMLILGLASKMFSIKNALQILNSKSE